MSGRVVQGWQPDPFGLHEARYFSAAGQPTKLVRDRGTESYDEPPSGPDELAAARARMPPPLPPPAAYAPQGYVPVPRAAYPPVPAPRRDPRRRASGIVGFVASAIILAVMAAAAILVALTVLHPAKNAGAPRPDGSSSASSSSTAPAARAPAARAPAARASSSTGKTPP